MPDILIRGMEMPESCADCPICYDMMECSVSPLRFWNGRTEIEQFDFCNERHPSCPLHELPEHGDLIESEPIKRFITDGLNRKEFGYDQIQVLTEVEYAPVIVPADKEETPNG